MPGRGGQDRPLPPSLSPVLQPAGRAQVSRISSERRAHSASLGDSDIGSRCTRSSTELAADWRPESGWGHLGRGAPTPAMNPATCSPKCWLHNAEIKAEFRHSGNLTYLTSEIIKHSRLLRTSGSAMFIRCWPSQGSRLWIFIDQTISYLMICLLCHRMYQGDYENSIITQTFTGSRPCEGGDADKSEGCWSSPAMRTDRWTAGSWAMALKTLREEWVGIQTRI